MYVAHWSIFAPSQSGMYETTRDLIEAEREIGIAADMICMVTPEKAQRDGTFYTATKSICNLADIYALHSRVDQPYYSDDTPIVFFAHGMPAYTWQTELYGLEAGNPAPWSTSLNYFRAPEIKRIVTFWADQMPYWRALDGPRAEERVRLVPRGLRFGDRYTPDGPNFELDGEPCLIIADSLRLCKDMVEVLFGAARFGEKYPQARLHLFGIPEPGNRIGDAIRSTVAGSQLRNLVSSVNGINREIEQVFRSGDILLSSVRGESRVAIEAQACGMDVVTQSCRGTWEADFRDPDTIAARIEEAWLARKSDREGRRQALAAKVRAEYDMRRTAEALKAVYEELV